MKVLIAGAHGNTGKTITELLSKSNQHEAYAMIRKEGQADELKKLGTNNIVLADLKDDLSEAVKDKDAVIFAAGSQGKDVIGVDQDGAKRLIDASKKAGVKHFVMLSSYSADTPQGELKEYLKAKGEADRYLRESGLTYTIVRPGGLGSDEPIGKVEVAEHFETRKETPIPRADVAQVLVGCLEVDNVKNKTFELFTGDTPIKEALESYKG
ncbi:SDR family oxidoreductase [Pontibacter silvestris]|uniref:SDR family oxidoreductase n=1 Tax=Pontibacter silvestris TaxID=2305183 RepID=A0ABW4WRT3_9BACT|nr:SDR family oxidoreductase [Pontibacter silvestris]MCC9136175.1 SDR family oxidoreductase [Pontibacter silvestris]